LSALQLPTLLLAGELDSKFVTINQQMAAQIPNARLEIIEGAGHTTHLERPSAFQQSVLNFLRMD
jgi:2-succinyl-6-hydroxy-2,4-cyclohexadiene-1-carboxylate synthase